MSIPKLSLLSYQIEFIEAQKNHLYPAFVGGTGSGKSYVLAVGAILDAFHSANAIIGVYGPTIAHVRDICMEYILNLLISKFNFKKGKTEYDGDFHVNKNEMKIISHHPQLGSFIFKSMSDPDEIIGYQTYTAHVDELDTMEAAKAEKAWQNIGARTRQWPEGLTKDLMQWNPEFLNDNGTKGRWEPRNKMCAYTTPEGFKFVYRTWKKSKDPEYVIVKGKTKDNHFNGAAYFKTQLAKFGGDIENPRAKAYLEGDFVNMESGAVYYAFNRGDDKSSGHSSKETVRKGESLFIGMDFNVGKMAAAIFVKRKGGLEWHCVDEITDVLDTPDIISVIRERYPNHPITVYPDASGKSRDTGNASISDISLLKTAGFIVRAKSKNPFVKDRVSAVNKGFMDGKVFVNIDMCPTITDCLEQQAYDKSGKPSKDSGHDHCNDAFGYPLAFEMPLRKPLFSVPIRWIA